MDALSYLAVVLWLCGSLLVITVPLARVVGGEASQRMSAQEVMYSQGGGYVPTGLALGGGGLAAAGASGLLLLLTTGNFSL